MKTDNSSIIKSHCNECGHETSHAIVYNECVTGADPQTHPYEYVAQWSTTWQLLKCCGCQEISLQKSDWFSEYQPDEQYPPEYYPPRVARPKPRWFEKLPDDYKALMSEIYKALQSDSRRLAMMGARCVIDLFIQNKVGDQGTFEKGMDSLGASGFISLQNEEFIKAAIEAGNACAHRAYNPPIEQMEAVMDIIENLIQHDVLEASSMGLKSTTPKRTQ